MWIGAPGSLRQIRDGAKTFDRSPDVGVAEFRSLAGGVTTWAPSLITRRYKIAWEAMTPEDANHIDGLARQVAYMGPLVVLDPLASNLLTGRQSRGKGVATQWGYNTSEVTMVAINAPPVSQVAYVTALPASGATEIVWLNPSWYGYPVPGGQPVTWWPYTFSYSPAAPAVEGFYLHWYNSANTLVSSSMQADPSRPLVASPPAGAVFVRPAVRLKATGFYSLGQSVLSLGDASAALLAAVSSLPVGEGSPGFSITGYRNVATPGNGAYRDIGLDLVEVTSSAVG
ncbi:hypothetical protein [Streptomyces sp. NPDC048623]|uniref:hypothetical protein n=1 Tax=Streptomyces sp. NPDC048623 TaxID=3155761 RepID=UPI00341E3DE4